MMIQKYSLVSHQLPVVMTSREMIADKSLCLVSINISPLTSDLQSDKNTR